MKKILKETMKKILKDPRTYYVIALIVIFLYPPINQFYPSGRKDFVGWDFIGMVGYNGRWHISIPVIAIEFFIVSVIYFIYRKKG